MNMKDRMNARSLYENAFETGKWVEEVPYLNFKEEWSVKILPPFCGAIIRFHIEAPNGNRVSVYLDGYDILGSMGQPYWEVFGGCRDVTERFLSEEHEQMMAYIEESLEATYKGEDCQ